MFPDDLGLFQYYKGIGIGTLIGLGFGWLSWRLPTVLRTRRARKLRKIVLDLHRIEDGFKGRQGPNPRELRVQRVPLRDRIMEWWQVWIAEWRASAKPRTPEQVAQEAHEREPVGAT